MRCPHCHKPIDQQDLGLAALTKRQHEIYSYLVGFSEEHGYAPSFEEIAEVFGYASLATVHEHLSNLDRKGYIARRYNESRSIICLIELPGLSAPAGFSPNPSGSQDEAVPA